MSLPQAPESPISPGGWIAANLVIGVDGSTTLGGSSKGLSTSVDRSAFHLLRQQFQAILIGGNTARNEPYSKTPLPLIVLSHRVLEGAVAGNPLAERWDMPLRDALLKARSRYGRVLMEAGPTLLTEALSEKLIDELFLTLSPLSGGDNHFDIERYLHGATKVSHSEIEGTTLACYRFH